MEYLHPQHLGEAPFQTVATLRLCPVTAHIEGIISSNRTASGGCYKYKRIKSNYFPVVSCEAHPTALLNTGFQMETSVWKTLPERLLSFLQEMLSADTFCYTLVNICSRCTRTKQWGGQPSLLVQHKVFPRFKLCFFP